MTHVNVLIRFSEMLPCEEFVQLANRLSGLAYATDPRSPRVAVAVQRVRASGHEHHEVEVRVRLRDGAAHCGKGSADSARLALYRAFATLPLDSACDTGLTPQLGTALSA